MSRGQRIFLSPPHLSGVEQWLIAEAFASNYIAPLGPLVDAFGREFAEYTGIPHRLAHAGSLRGFGGAFLKH